MSKNNSNKLYNMEGLSTQIDESSSKIHTRCYLERTFDIANESGMGATKDENHDVFEFLNKHKQTIWETE